MRTISKEKLKEIIKKHHAWLLDQNNGERANLSYANLSSANLRYADLSYADLSYADLRHADLRSADLRHADLRSANLRHANLRHANLCSFIISSCRGNNNTIKSIHCDTYDIAYTDKILQIGCEQHDILDWWKFDNKRILEMEGKKALKWWKVWKPLIKKIIKFSPAENNGFVEKEQ